MINNYLCQTCNHSLVCEMFSKKVSPFSVYAKKDLGINIEIINCANYESTGEPVVNEIDIEDEFAPEEEDEDEE